MPKTQSAWQIYAEELATLGYGLPLWEPAPLHNYRKVAIGDVGYIQDGCFHLLFNAASPLDTRVLGVDVPQDFSSIAPGPAVLTQPRLPGALHSKDIVDKGASADVSPDISFIHAGANLHFQSLRERGAILMTKFRTYREDAERLGYFKGHMEHNYQSWLTYAKKSGHLVELKDIIFVTGHDMTRDFSMLAFSSSSQQMGTGIDADVPSILSASASVFGTWKTTMSAHRNSGPHHREPPSDDSGVLLDLEDFPSGDPLFRYDQCVFLRGYRVRKRFGLIPKVIKAAAGPHDLGSGHRFDGEGPSILSDDSERSDCEILSEAPLFVDPLEPVFRYIFENSSADVAIVHDLDLFKATGMSTQVDINTLVSLLTPDMISVGPDSIAFINTQEAARHANSGATHLLEQGHTGLHERIPQFPVLPGGLSVPGAGARAVVKSGPSAPQELSPPHGAVLECPVPLPSALEGEAREDMGAPPVPPESKKKLAIVPEETQAEQKPAGRMETVSEAGTVTVWEAAAKKDKALAEAEAEREKALAEAEAERERAFAEAEAEREKALAEAEVKRERAVAEAKAERKKTVAEAEAEREMAVVEAEAEGKRAVAEAEAEEKSERALAEAEAKRQKAVAEAEAKRQMAVAEVEARRQMAVAEAEAERQKTTVGREDHEEEADDEADDIIEIEKPGSSHDNSSPSN